MRKDIQNAWMQMWSPPARFERAELEQKFLATYCLQSAPHRRSAVILGIAVSLLYVVWDFFNWKADPAYREAFSSILATRVGTVTELIVVLGFASFTRFEWDERYASNVLFIGCLFNFVFYSISFQLVPYPYDYMYFFVGMFINVVFGFAMLRMRARPVLWLMVLCMAIAVCAFVGNGQTKQASLDTPAAKIYQAAALIFFFTVAMIGFIVANLLERTTRMSFSRTEELAVSNQNLVAHAEKVEQLNGSLQTAVTRVKQESAARARVLASASHDLRQPLHALSIYSAILVVAPNPPPDTLRELSSNIDQIARSLGALLHGLLDLSQLSAGHYVSVRQRVALDDLLANICREFESAAAAKGLSLSCHAAPVTLFGDSMAISRIARNLLDNAIKYSEDGSVTVRLEKDAWFAIMAVEDTGRGMEPSDQRRIFEEFYQVDNHGRDRNRGVGLGLAIVQRLVELISGTIAVASRPGKGSCFTVRVPLLQDALQSTRELSTPTSSLPPDLEGLRIYVVDDEADILRSTSMLLTSWKCEVATALSLADVKALFDRSGAPDLLIADLRLRENESGLDVAHQMRRAYGDFPILFVTGETASDALSGVKAGGWTVLHKPIDVDMLRQAILESIA